MADLDFAYWQGFAVCKKYGAIFADTWKIRLFSSCHDE
jgi:hypothetical protein